MEHEKMSVKTPLKKRIIKRFVISVFLLFVLLNFVAAFQSWNFTHFSKPDDNFEVLTENSSFWRKSKAILLGIKVPKPKNRNVDLDFVEVDTIQGETNLEIWRFDMEPSKGVVALFHGYKATKSSLWNEAQAFYRMGYTVILVDFRASGNSDGNQCTIGYFEAQDVSNTVDWCKENYPDQNVFLYGVSMGAAAILRSVGELNSQPDAILIQSSFATMLGTAKNRFNLMGLPEFPLAHLLTFWGGFLNDFDAYNYQPIRYAKNVHCPTLVIHGMLDNRVSYLDSKGIYTNISGPKEFATFSKSGHESILNKEEANWLYLVTNFMETHNH